MFRCAHSRHASSRPFCRRRVAFCKPILWLWIIATIASSPVIHAEARGDLRQASTPVTTARAGGDTQPLVETSPLFPTPPVVRKQVRFWERVFKTYPTTTLLLHDSQNPDIIIDLLEFAGKTQCPTCLPKASRKQREAVAQRFLDRYTRGLARFAQIRDKALDFGAIERRLFDVYSRDPGLLHQLYRGNIRLRIQTGLADEFAAATATAQAYFPAMERIFLEQGVPTALTRLPFVESMFNPRAISKVGASGLWQFMPETGRRFLSITTHVDERNSPLKATRAAAQLMLSNYRDLKSWPLAITAYNHGSLGMAKAAKDTGSRDIGTIIDHYQSPSFGFASRNFYAEFLAAQRTFQSLAREGKIRSKVNLSATEPLTLPHAMTPSELMQATALSATDLMALNPCLLPQAFSKHLHRHLPKGYQLFFPKHEAARIKANIEKYPSTRYARR